MAEEKSSKHNIVIRVLSPTEITYDQAVFKLASSFYNNALEENGLLILGYDFDDPETGTHSQRKRKAGKSQVSSKLGDLAARSPGVLGDFFSLLKGYKWHQLYMGFAALVIGGALLWKWLIRLITGTF